MVSLWNGLQLYSSRIVVLFKLESEPLAVDDLLVRRVVVSMSRYIITEQYYDNIGSKSHGTFQCRSSTISSRLKTKILIASPMFSCLVEP